MIVITAINKTHQATVNRMYIADRKYSDLVNANDVIADTGEFEYPEDNKLYRQGMVRQERAFDTFITHWDTLPKREQKNAERQYKAIHGYSMN